MFSMLSMAPAYLSIFLQTAVFQTAKSPSHPPQYIQEFLSPPRLGSFPT